MSTMSAVCYSVESGLRAMGIWPDVSYAILRQILCISSIAIFQILQYQYLIMHLNEDLFILIDVLSVAMAYSLGISKLVILMFNTHLLNEILVHMLEDWKRRDVSETYTMTRMYHISRRFSNMMISIYALSVVFYCTSTIIRNMKNNGIDAHDFIYKLDLPFEIKSTLVYISLLLTQCVHQTATTSASSVVNSLLITLVLHVCGQIDIVRQKLNEITRKNMERGDTNSIMKMLIARHQRIILFSKNIHNLYSNIALVEFFTSTLVICCVGFLIIVSVGLPNGMATLAKSVLFYIGICVDAFIFCFAGEYLSTKSKMIGDAAYESIWYESNPTQTRDILLMILRSQKHLILSAGKFADLSFQQFANIMKASASYVSVLYAMY